MIQLDKQYLCKLSFPSLTDSLMLSSGCHVTGGSKSMSRICRQGRTEKLKGGGRILRKINSFCEILNKVSQKGGGAKDHHPLFLWQISEHELGQGKELGMKGIGIGNNIWEGYGIGNGI